MKATDGAKSLAEEQGIDISGIEGSGKEGQVTKADVEAALSEEPVQEKMFRVQLSPKLDRLSRLEMVASDGTVYVLSPDEPRSMELPESVIDDLNAQMPFEYLLKGKEI